MKTFLKEMFTELRSSASPIGTIAKHYGQSGDPFLMAFSDAHKQYSQTKDIPTLLNDLNHLDVLDSPAPETTVLFFLTKGMFEIISGNLQGAILSIGKAKDSLQDPAPTVLQTWLEFLMAKVMGFEKKFVEYANITNHLDLDFEFDYWVWRQISFETSAYGLFSFDPKNIKIKNRIKENENLFNSYQFVDLSAKGQAVKAKEFLAKLSEDVNDIGVIYERKMLDILSGDYSKKNWKYYAVEKISYRKVYDYLIALAQKKPMEALNIAKEIVNLGEEDFSWTTKLVAKAELCLGNTEAAIYLMHSVEHDREFFDHLTLARIHYQKKNMTLAFEHFHKIYNHCLKNNSLPRLTFEIKCCLELNPEDVFILMNSLKDQKNIILSPKIDLQAKTKTAKLFGANRYIGSSQSSLHVKEEIVHFAKIDMPVLITGETGAGKEVVAQAIHEESDNSKEPFLPINCGAIVGSLLQSELFGHKEGAFTSAHKGHIGIFEAAGNGTVFLDEFGEMSAQTQVALLRVLETKEIRPIGSSKAKTVNCRIIAATNANILALINEGKFRRDLYYRLKSLEIKLQPLRERKDDIIELAIHFLSIGRSDNSVCTIDKGAQKILLSHSWPGNARELQNEMHKVRMLNSNKLNYQAIDFKSLVNNEFAEKDTYHGSVRDSLDEVKSEEPASGTVTKLVSNFKSSHRRIEEIKILFLKYKVLRRVEIVNSLKIAQKTATKDLKELIDAKFIRKVTPTKSSRTHYFELI